MNQMKKKKSKTEISKYLFTIEKYELKIMRFLLI
jgi:hypothetical protein